MYHTTIKLLNGHTLKLFSTTPLDFNPFAAAVRELLNRAQVSDKTRKNVTCLLPTIHHVFNQSGEGTITL